MIAALAALLLLFSQTVPDKGKTPLLTKEAVWLIVVSTPDAVRLEARGGCPQIELIPEGSVLMSAQLRNRCPSSGNGMIDNYTVDLKTGEIWTGIDDRHYIDSERLRRLRAVLLRK